MDARSDWSGGRTSGLFDCCDDASSCLLGYFCPCVAFGRVTEIVDKGSSSRPASCCIYYCLLIHLRPFLCLYTMTYRAKLRDEYGLPETPCADLCVHCCCPACALCQEYRELKNRGFDMGTGWNGYMQMQGPSEAPVVQGMTR